MLVASEFIDVYAIISQEDSAPPKLVLLHRVLVSSSEPFFAPFVGSQCTYVIGIYRDTLKTITISHDHALPPSLQHLGNLEPLPMTESVPIKYGPSTSVIQRSQTSLEFITYEYSIESTCFLRKKYNLLNNDSNPVTRFVGFDDSMSRVVLESGPACDEFLVSPSWGIPALSPLFVRLDVLYKDAPLWMLEEVNEKFRCVALSGPGLLFCSITF